MKALQASVVAVLLAVLAMLAHAEDVLYLYICGIPTSRTTPYNGSRCNVAAG